MGGLFAALLPGVSLALQRADDLRRMHEDAGRPICENPSTTVDALLAALEQADAAWRRK